MLKRVQLSRGGGKELNTYVTYAQRIERMQSIYPTCCRLQNTRKTLIKRSNHDALGVVFVVVVETGLCYNCCNGIRQELKFQMAL